MDRWQCCRTCLGVKNLNPIFATPEHIDKYSEVLLAATGIEVDPSDALSQQMCTDCISFINDSYKFRKKCEHSHRTLLHRLQHNLYEPKLEPCMKTEIENSIDITELIDDFRDLDDNITLSEYHNVLSIKKEDHSLNETDKTNGQEKPVKKRARIKEKGQGVKIMKEKIPKEKRAKEKKELARGDLKCELCNKSFRSIWTLKEHNKKIHTGLNTVCEHCGKKFIAPCRLLMHCKAKHGYEKTDKCSFCDYRASNADQVKVHERLHTGEKPFVCSSCGASFHRKSTYLQHVAIHLPEKTVQCDQCPARFKSVTLMRIHKRRHGPAQYTYKCRVCHNTFARRRNLAKHLLRIHALQPDDDHIERIKISAAIAGGLLSG